MKNSPGRISHALAKVQPFARCQILIIAHNHRQEDVVVPQKQSAVPACGKFTNHDTNTIAGTALLRTWVQTTWNLVWSDCVAMLSCWNLPGSVSTRRQDLIAKRELYSEQHVPHYLIIDPDHRSIEHVTAGGSSQHTAGETIEFSLHADCLVSFECSQLFD